MKNLRLRSLYSSLLLIAIQALLFPNTAKTQDTLDRYLRTNALTLNIKDTANDSDCAMIAAKLADYRVIMLGEGGSHELEFYFSLKSYLLKLLNQRLGLRSFVMEYGSALATLYNHYLETGDSTGLPAFTHPGSMPFLRDLYKYNHLSATTSPIRTIGIDFERAATYFKALRVLLPSTPPPKEIKEEIDTIANSGDSLDCNALLRIDRYLKRSLQKKLSIFEQYFGRNYTAVSNIITNPGLCNSRLNNRNYHLAERFELFDSLFKDSIYYCELGEAHVNFAVRNASWLLNTDKKSPFYHKVAVINVYCYNCRTPTENVSNWTFGDLQKDIETRFIPYCHDDFTLFDLTASSDPAISRFAACGQFLLIVKGQR